jgi:hypothetical protein
MRALLIVAALLLPLALWPLYLAVMHLDTARRQGRLTPAAKAIGYPLLYFGLLLDGVVNVVHGTIVFAELPREWTTSRRLARWAAVDDDWRGDLARWICAELLDPFDPDGRHCT